MRTKITLLIFFFLFSVFSGWSQLLNRTLYNEKVYLSTDKDIYGVCDTIRVKGFVADAWEHRTDSVSRFVYIELVDLSDNIKERRKIRRDSLGFATAIAIDTSLNVGNYYLRVYTQPMKYLDPSYIYTRSVVIDHAEREPQPLESANQLLSSGSEISVRFFAEGGNRVNGSAQRIAFRCTDKHGLPVYLEGVVKSSHGDTVAQVATRYNGFGEFMCIPQPKEKYTFYASNDKRYEVELPESGPALKVVGHQNTLRYKAEGLAEPHTLVIHAHGGVIHSQTVTPANASGILKIDSLKGGILCFSLFKEKTAEPVSERLCFIAPKTERRLSVSVENGVARITSDTPLKGDFVVTQTPRSALNNPTIKCGITSTLLLQSDLQQVVINPDYLLKEASNSAVIDMILLTERWGRFVKEVGDYDYGYTKETTEFISGRVKEGKPTSVLLVGSILDKAYPLEIDKEGYFGAELPDFFGTADFYARPTLKNGKAASSVVEMRQDFFPEVRNPRKVLSSTTLSLVRTETVREKQSDYVRTPINRSFKNEEGLITYTTGDVTVKGHKRDTTTVDTKEFYGINFMKQEDVLRYGKTNIAQAIGRLMNVVVDYVDGGAEFDFPHYEVYSKRSISIFGMGTPTRFNGKEYGSPLSKVYCPMRVAVDGTLVDEDNALRMSPYEVESIERLTSTQTGALFGTRGGMCGVISITTAKTVEQNTENKRTVIGGSVEKLGMYANLKSAYNANFIPLTRIDSQTTIPLADSTKETVIRIEGITQNGDIIDFVQIVR